MFGWPKCGLSGFVFGSFKRKESALKAYEIIYSMVSCYKPRGDFVCCVYIVPFFVVRLLLFYLKKSVRTFFKINILSITNTHRQRGSISI